MHRFSLLALICLFLGWADAGWSQETVKSPIHGLVTMGRLDFVRNPKLLPDNSLREANAHPKIYAGVVILAKWSQLEPSEGAYDFQSIDQGLDSVRAYNNRYSDAPLVAKFRIFAGPNAPEWAKHLGGDPVWLFEKDVKMELGRFWSGPYRAAWKKLQDALAAKYDSDPLVQEVAVSSCSSMTAEPFIVPLRPDNISVLHAAGYTDQAMQAGLLGAIDDYAGWKQVALDYTFNLFRGCDGGRIKLDETFAPQVMALWRQRLGARGVIANHGLKSDLSPAALAVYAEIKKLGSPVEFQTYSPAVDWEASFKLALQYGVTELEIWDTTDARGFAPISREQLMAWQAALKHP
jgi:hypothetical protein